MDSNATRRLALTLHSGVNIMHFCGLLASRAGCWMREPDEECYLYVALEGLTDDNSDIAYGEVLRITQAMTDHYVDPFRVKLITTGNAVAKAIMDIHGRFSARIPTRFDGRIFARRAVEDVYVYPQFPVNP